MTKAEKKRLVLFEEKAESLVKEGYTRKDLKVSPVKANFTSMLITIPLAIVLGIIYVSCNYQKFGDFDYRSFRNMLLTSLFVFIFFGIICHEFIHGVCWAISNKKHWKAISFGFTLKGCAPYCTCNETLTKKQYVIGGIMPTIILGIILGAIAVLVNSPVALLVAMLSLIGGGGDIMMIIFLLKFKPEGKDILYYDHPTEIGTVCFYK